MREGVKLNEVDLLHELAPEAERLLNRHLSQAKEWFPHELVPWERVKRHDPRKPFDPECRPLPAAVLKALILNLLTEDNLPYYTTEITRLFGLDHAWGFWNRRWTGEEGRHAIVIRDYLTVSGMVDPIALERARMKLAMYGFHQPIVGAAEGFVYVALQELATRISHWNTGKLLDDAAGHDVMFRVGADENLHYLFYKDVAKAAIALDPSAMVLAMEAQVRGFQMPGTGVEGFSEYASAIASAGIYNLRIHYYEILVPVIKTHWRLEHLEGLSPAAEEARLRLLAHLARIERLLVSQASRQAKKASLRPG